MKTRTLIRLLILASLAPAGAFAQTTGGPLLDWSIGYRVEYQENIAQLPDDEIDDIVSAPFLGVALDRAGTVLDARINGFVEHASYLDDTFDNDLRASLTSNFVWRISDERLHWVLNDSMSESSVDARSFRNPANQQLTNSLSTGPDLILRPSATDRVTIGARYKDFYAEETDDDSDGWLVSAAWNRRFAPSRTMGLLIKTETVEFDRGSLNADYDRHDATLEYGHQRTLGGARHDLKVNLGYTVVEFDQPAIDDRDAPALRLSWESTHQSGRRIRVTVAQEIGNIASELDRVIEAPRPDVVFATAVTGDPFERRGVQLEWSNQWQRLSLDASGFYDDLSYDVQLDQEFFGVRLGLSYLLRPLVNVRASVDWSDREFTDVDQDDETVGVSAGLVYQRTRHWSYALSAFWTDRSSSDGALDADNAGISAEIIYRR